MFVNSSELRVRGMLSLAKAHAYGNDFLFVPGEQAEGHDLAALARQLCARHTGVGADGLILYTTAPDGTARMRLLNADGSDSELSGNGLRCLAALVLNQRLQGRDASPIDEIRVDTDAGWKHLRLVSHGGGRFTFRAAMGPPVDVHQETLEVEGESLVDRLPDPRRFERLGPALATHPRFAAGTNVEFAQIESPGRVRILIWERGVGPTHASGTGACAAAVAAAAHGGASRDIEVVAPGGSQRVEWQADGVYLTGWAELVFEGHWLRAPAHGARFLPGA
jgi:diaminopimelate epimerase